MMFVPTLASNPTSSYYYRTLSARLEKAISFVTSRSPEEVRLQFPHLSALLKSAWPHPWLHHLAVKLVEVLYPWPKRWGFIDEWLVILQSTVEACRSLNLRPQEAEFLRHLTERYVDMGNFAAAIETGQKAITLSLHHQLSYSLAWAGLITHRALLIVGRYQEADQLLTTIIAETASAKLSSQHTLIDALLILMEARMLRQQHLSQHAAELVEPLLQQIESLNKADPHLAAQVHAVYGWLSYDLNRFDEMLIHLQKAVTKYELIGDTIQADVMRGELSYAYLSAGEYDTAERLLLDAISRMEQHHWQHKVIQYMGYLVGVCIGRGELPRALLYVGREAALSRLIGSTEGVHHALMNQGAVLLLLGQYETGLASIQEALQAFQFAQEHELVLLCQMDMCFAYWHLGQKVEGEKIAQQILAVATNELTSLPHLSLFARRCLALFRPPIEAIELLRQALLLAQKHNSRLQQAACLISLAGLVSNERESHRLWAEGADILQAMNALAWLDGCSPKNPPFIANLQ